MPAGISLAITEQQDAGAPQGRKLLNRAKCSSLKPPVDEDEQDMPDIQRRHTGLDSSLTSHKTFLEMHNNSNNLRRWRHQTRQMSPTESREDNLKDYRSTNETDDLEPMRGDSFEYQIDSQYVNSWLNEIPIINHDELLPRKWASFTEDRTWIENNAARLGINTKCNWFSDSSLDNNKVRSRESLRADLQQLNNDYIRLCSYLVRINENLDRVSSVKKVPANLPEAKPSESANMKRHHDELDECDKISKEKANQELDNKMLELELQALQLQLDKYGPDEVGDPTEAIALSEEAMAPKNSEISKLKENIDKLTGYCEAGGKLKYLIDLQRENSELREVNEEDQLELRSLKEKYYQLNKQYLSLGTIYDESENASNLKTANYKSELCALRVRISQIEQLTSMERDIKLELQEQLERTKNSNNTLEDDIEELENSSCLAMCKTTTPQRIDTLKATLRGLKQVWQELVRQKKDVDLQLKECNDSIEDSRREYLDRVDELRTTHQAGLEELQKSQAKAEAEKQLLVDEIKNLNLALSEMRSEKDDLTRKILTARSNLTLMETKFDLIIKETVIEKEKLIQILEERLGLIEDECSGFHELLMGQKEELAQLNAGHKELHEKFRVQQSEFKATKERRDSDITKLRQALNLERYERQVMKREIDRELKLNLNELESMKYRFLKRMLVAAPKGGEFLQQQLSTVAGQNNDYAEAQQSPGFAKIAVKTRVQFDDQDKDEAT